MTNLPPGATGLLQRRRVRCSSCCPWGRAEAQVHTQQGGTAGKHRRLQFPMDELHSQLWRHRQ